MILSTNINYFYDKVSGTLAQEIAVIIEKKKYKALSKYTHKENKTKKFLLTVQPALFDYFKTTAKSISSTVNNAFTLSMINFIEKKEPEQTRKLFNYTHGQKKTQKVCICVQPELHTHFKEVAEDAGYKINQALMFAMIAFIENNAQI